MAIHTITFRIKYIILFIETEFENIFFQGLNYNGIFSMTLMNTHYQRHKRQTSMVIVNAYRYNTCKKYKTDIVL